MANTFLRSGNLDSVLALGENGQPVWLSALQIRETLRLRQQQTLADLLAIPQPNEAGNRLDWYAPFAGKIVPWNSASESARNAALKQLDSGEAALREMSEKALAASKHGQQLFGALLAKALQFPDQNYVYLVAGRPVITFWGFTSLNKKQTTDALELLRNSAQEEAPLSLSKASAPLAAATVSAAPPAAAKTPTVSEAAAPADDAPEATPRSQPDLDAPLISTPAPVVSPAPSVVAEEDAAVYQRPLPKAPAAAAAPAEPSASPAPQPAPAAQPQPAAVQPSPAARPWLRYGWMLPGAALVAVLGFQLKSCIGQHDATPPAAGPVQNSAPAPAVQKPAEPAPAASTAATAPAAAPAPVSTPQPAPAVAQPVLPVKPASVTPAPAPAAEPAAEPAPATEPAPAPSASPATPAEKDDLVLPALSVKLGSTKFFNGSWRGMLDIKTPITGKPPVLRYKMNNGKGIARLTQGDGTTCQVEVFAGIMKTGQLQINSRTKARCSDGARFQIPELNCSQPENGPAQCIASYDASTTYPITMKREGK